LRRRHALNRSNQPAHCRARSVGGDLLRWAAMETARAAVPAIYLHGEHARPLDPLRRAVALLTAVGCLGVLVIAAMITPSPVGVGTHLDMPIAGLQPCDFLARTGLPCPSCGMTTSFAWFARGNLLASLYIQPMGFALALLAAAAFWVALYIGLTGKPAVRLLRHVPARYYLLPLFALGVAGWAWKMFTILRGIDGWQ
jgi:hypothetical protein